MMLCPVFPHDICMCMCMHARACTLHMFVRARVRAKTAVLSSVQGDVPCGPTWASTREGGWMHRELHASTLARQRALEALCLCRLLLSLAHMLIATVASVHRPMEPGRDMSVLQS